MTQDDIRRMQYEEMYANLMSKARAVYLAKHIAEDKLRSNGVRLQSLTGKASIFGRKARRAEIDDILSENQVLRDGIREAEQMLEQIIAKLDEMEPNLGDRAVLYARDTDDRWLKRQ